MNKGILSLMGLILLTLTSCATNRIAPRQAVLCQQYYHTYGVEISPEEWNKRGKCGEIVTKYDNGITERKSYAAGLLHGMATKSFPHTLLTELAEEYSQGNLVKRIVHYPSGAPKQQEEWLDEERYVVSTWYDDGVPKAIEQYQEERLMKGEYYTPNQELDTAIVDGNGQRNIRNLYGQVVAVDLFREGERVLCTTYFPSGSKKSITPYLLGKIHGERQTFLPDGQPQRIESWIAGKQEGATLMFENGVVVARIPYEDGEKHGIEKRYAEGERLVEEITWEHGNRHGPSNTIVENHIKTDWYFADQLVSKAAYEARSQPFVY